MSHKRTYEEWVSLVSLRNPIYLVNNTVTKDDFNVTSGKVRSVCNVCGYERLQDKYSIQIGLGCKKCAMSKTAGANRYTQETWLNAVFSKYPENEYLYDYSETEYTISGEKVKIKCNLCNKNFHPIANNHLRGSGCPSCNRIGRQMTIAEREKDIFINTKSNFYIMKVGDYYKYGISCSPTKRAATIKCESGAEVDILFEMPMNSYFAILVEDYFRKLLSPYYVNNSLSFSGYTETFLLDEDQISDLIEFASSLEIRQGDSFVNLP